MANRGKILYIVDPHNRLIARSTGKASRVKPYRYVLDGSFKIGPKNSLIYHIKKSPSSDIPQQIKLTGKYSLDKNQNLIFTLNKWNNQILGNKLIIQTELINASDNELSFMVSTRDPAKKKARIYTLNLSGTWHADSRNELSFSATKPTGPKDTLTLKGSWKIGSNNELIYKQGKAQNLTFKGYWEVFKKYQISYVLNKKIGSKFDFEIGLLKPTKRGLKYKISIGISPIKTYAISGSLKLIKTDKTTLEFGVKNLTEKHPKLTLRLDRKILKDKGIAFIEASKEGKDTSILTGLSFRW